MGNYEMRILLAIAVSACSGIGLGFWRGQWGREMLSAGEQVRIALALVIVLAFAAWTAHRLLPLWVSLVLPNLLFLLLATGAWKVFEPRLHLNFYGNGFTCWMRSVPAAVITIIFALLILEKRLRLPVGLLGASAAILAQSIYCPIVESRHIMVFHAGQILVWPLLMLLVRKTTRPNQILNK